MSDPVSWKASMLLAGQPFLVASRQEAQTKRGGTYLNLVLKGHGGREIGGKVWDQHQALFERFRVGRVLSLSGRLEEYQGLLSLIIEGAEDSPLPPSEFLRQTHIDVENTWSKLRGLVNGMQEPLTRFISQRLMERPGFEAAYKRAPAAKRMHNNWTGGLIEHVYSLCMLAEPIIAHYQRLYHAPLSRDKVLFGLIFHDAGKIQEYDIDSPAFDTSPVGQFVPHIVLGPAWVYEAAKHFPGKADHLEVAHLMHILAAHHGTEAWGSPVKPASLEAVIVHHLDNLDAKVLHALEFVKGEPGPIPHFSARSKAENTPFFQPSAMPSAASQPSNQAI